MTVRRMPPVGETIGLAFGALWCFLGAQGLPAAMQGAIAWSGAAATVLLLFAVWRRRWPAIPSSTRPRGWIITVSIVAEVIALILANSLLPQYGFAEWVLPVVGVIVGLHFIGFQIATGMRRFRDIALALCVISAGAALLPFADGAVNPRVVTAGFGNALALWIGAALPMRTGGR